MHRCLFALAVITALAAPARAAEPAAIVTRYAAALQTFDPALDRDRALRLAYRTIAESTAYGLDARLVVALIAVESSWNPGAVSPAGARGLGQLMPGTAEGLRVDPDEPEANLDGTIRHLRGLLDRYARYPMQERFVRRLQRRGRGG
jgi:soluble lytic murein transglycosylase-like protein